MNINNKKLAGSIISVSSIVLLSKIFGFVRQIVMADAFGATIDTDIISLAQGLVTNVDYIIVQSLMTAFVPTYIHLKAEGESRENIFMTKTLIICFLGSFLLAFMMMVLSTPLSKIIAPSYSSNLSAELTKYIWINAPVLVFIVLTALYNALLKSNEIFVPGELVGLIQSIIYICFIVAFGNYWGPRTLVVAFYFSAITNLAYLMIYSRKIWGFRFSTGIIDPDVRRLLNMMTPLILGYSMIFLNQEIDAIIVSGLGDGVVTAMSYAAVLSNFVSTFIGSVCGVLFTYVTQKIAEKDDSHAAELLNSSSIYLITLVLPISIIFLMNSNDIVLIVFGHGNFGKAAIDNCSYALFGYSFMYVPYVVREMFSRFQYGYGDSKQPMINSVIAIIINTILSIILSMFFGVMGVTFATSVSVITCSILNVLSSKKKNGKLAFDSYARILPFWIAGSLICVCVSLFFGRIFVALNELTRLLLVTLFSLIGYGIVNMSIIKQFILMMTNREIRR